MTSTRQLPLQQRVRLVDVDGTITREGARWFDMRFGSVSIAEEDAKEGGVNASLGSLSVADGNLAGRVDMLESSNAQLSNLVAALISRFDFFEQSMLSALIIQVDQLRRQNDEMKIAQELRNGYQ